YAHSHLVLALRGEDSIRRHGSHRRQIRGGQTLLHLEPGLLGRRQIGRRPREIAGAPHGGAAEQSFRERTEEMRRDRPGAEGLARDDDLRSIAPEGGDVVVNPPERGVLIEIAVVSRMPALLPRKLGVRHEAERAHAVVEAHEYRALFRDALAAVDGHARGADRTATAVDRDSPRPSALRRSSG